MKDNIKELEGAMGLLLVVMGGVLKVAAGVAIIVNKGNRNMEELANKWGDGSNQFTDMKDVIIETVQTQEKLTKETDESVKAVNNIHGGMKIVLTDIQKLSKTLKEINQNKLYEMKRTFENISMIIKQGVNNSITDMSMILARSVTYAESLSGAMLNMARSVANKVLAFMIELVSRQIISIAMEKAKNWQLLKQLSIEKMITAEKRAQGASSGSSMGSSIFDIGKKMLGFAKGGAVSKGVPITVGENGAETFIPNSTGQITQSARGTEGGGATTVNFNITTNDASGFEELLIRSRGTISALINDAVNERGQGSIV